MKLKIKNTGNYLFKHSERDLKIGRKSPRIRARFAGVEANQLELLIRCRRARKRRQNLIFQVLWVNFNLELELDFFDG